MPSMVGWPDTSFPGEVRSAFLGPRYFGSLERKLMREGGMTPEEAIKIVNTKANLRTRYEGQDAFLDEVLVAEIERLRVDYARLHGVVQTYINADPQVRGEAYRDLAGTMEHLAGADETYGWPAVWQRQRAEIDRLTLTWHAEMQTSAQMQRERDEARDAARTLLRSPHARVCDPTACWPWLGD